MHRRYSPRFRPLEQGQRCLIPLDRGGFYLTVRSRTGSGTKIEVRATDILFPVVYYAVCLLFKGETALRYHFVFTL